MDRGLLGVRLEPARQDLRLRREQQVLQETALRMNFSLGLFLGEACCGVLLLFVVGVLFKV